MRVVSRSSILIVVGVALTVGTITSLAQQDQGGPGRGNFDPAQMRERMMERYKEAINATDEEWKAISPLVETVMEKQRASFAGGRGMFGMGGPGGPGRMGRQGGNQGGGQNAPQGAQQGRRMGGPGGAFGEPMPEMEALRAAIEKEDTPAADIEAKLKEFRAARKAREAELQKAREELRKVLKIRQEATMVLMGLLD